MKSKRERESVKPSVDLSAPEHDDLFMYPDAFREDSENKDPKSSDQIKSGTKTSVIKWTDLEKEANSGASSDRKASSEKVERSQSKPQDVQQSQIVELFASIER